MYTPPTITEPSNDLHDPYATITHEPACTTTNDYDTGTSDTVADETAAYGLVIARCKSNARKIMQPFITPSPKAHSFCNKPDPPPLVTCTSSHTEHAYEKDEDVDNEIAEATSSYTNWKDSIWADYVTGLQHVYNQYFINDITRFVVLYAYKPDMDVVNCGIYCDVSQQWLFHPIFITSTLTKEDKTKEMQFGLQRFVDFVQIRLRLVSAAENKHMLMDMCSSFREGWTFTYW